MSAKATLDDVLSAVQEQDAKLAAIKDLEARIDAIEGDESRENVSEDQLAAIRQFILDDIDQNPDSEFARKMRFNTGGDERLVGTKFSRWNLDAEDIEFLYDLQMSLQGQKRVNGAGVYNGPSEDLANAFESISDAVYLDQETVRKIDRQAIDDLFPRVRKSPFSKAWYRFKNDQHYAQYERAMRAMDSAESGYGSQLVGAQYVADLWEAARPASPVFNLIESFEMSAPTAYLPVEADLPEMLFVSESTANNSSNYSTSKTGSNRVQVDAKKFVIHQMWSGELEEDAIIPFVPYLRRQAAISLGYYSDSLVLNGDTTNAATGNINLDDADPADTKHYLAFDGIRHAPLVDNTGNAADAGGAIALADFTAQRGLMRDAAAYEPLHWGMPAVAEDLVHVVDPSTYFSIMSTITQIITLEQYGPAATILSGEVGRVFNIPIIASQNVSLTEADGKVSTTAGNNTKGQMVTFNRRAFRVGWRRRVMMETERLPATDQTRLVHSLRMGFGRYSVTGAASGIEAAAVLYNITV